MKKRLVYILLLSLFITSFPISDAKAYHYSVYEEEEQEQEFNDPFEKLNRAIFNINIKFYKWISSPVLEGYRKITSPTFRSSLGNFSDNLKNPFFFINRVFQLDAKKSFNVLARATINTTAGFLGFFDVADSLGFEEEYTDMGLTFAKYGIGGGPYLMIPLYGPTNLRDGLGNLGDFAVDPLNFNVLEIGSHDSWLTKEQRWSRFVVTSFVDFERVKDALDTTLESSFDPYATVRSAYYQNREEKIRKNKWRKEE